MYMITLIRKNKKKDINSCTIIEVFNNNVFSNQAKTAYLMQYWIKIFHLLKAIM